MRILYLPNAYSQQRQREKPAKIYPVLMAMEAEWYRKQGHAVIWNEQNYIARSSGYYCPHTGQSELLQQVFSHNDFDKIITKPEGLPFLSLPHPDREFTRWWEYQKNGNFKYLPATYIQSADGCWWGKCSFCVEKGKPYKVRPVKDVWQEIIECKEQGFREVFDDSGTFPVGDWLDKFLDTFVPMDKRPVLGCNMRMADIDYKKMKWAGFRMLLFGLESANQETLDRINKGVKVEDYKYIIKAAKARLEPHVAVMFGYPWETDKEAINTLKLVHYLLRKGYAKTAQASFYQNNDGCPNNNQRTYIKKIYNVWKYPDFWFSKIRDIRDKDDLKYLWKQIKTGLKEWRPF